ncbi:TPA: P-loop NTPase fold protein [Vibrio parahaemolyticus]
MRLTIPDLNLTMDEGFSPEVDIFSRKEFGERLSNLIINSNENLVLALDSQWGEGKSTFIKMWCGENQNQSENSFQAIYFDAFENDYQKDPFLALASEIYELLEDSTEVKRTEFKEKATKVFKAFSRGLIKAGVKVGTAGLIDGSDIDKAEKELSTLLADQVDSVIASKFDSSKADKLALSNFKSFISDIAINHTKGNRIVFVIDELDRCRPDFALELLEKIKHLFSVPGITFLLVMNRSQLEESVKSRYGIGIDSSTYLQKFINVWLALPRVDSQNYNDFGEIFAQSCLNKMAANEPILNKEAFGTLSKLIKYNQPSFRDIERMLTYFAIIENVRNDQMVKYFQSMMALVCYLKVASPRLLDSIIKRNVTHTDVLKSLRLENPELLDCYVLEYLAVEIEFDLASEERRTQMFEQNLLDRFEMRRIPPNVIGYFCGLLNNMHP